MWRYVVNIAPAPWMENTTQGGLPVGSARGTWAFTPENPGVQRLHGWRAMENHTHRFVGQYIFIHGPVSMFFKMFMFTRGIYDLDPNFCLTFLFGRGPTLPLGGLRITMVNHFPRPGMIIQVGGKIWIGTYRNFGRTHKSTASPSKKKVYRWFPEN